MNKHAVICSAIVLLTLGATCRAGEEPQSIGQMECKLADMRKSYTDKHPEVMALKKAIDDRRKEAEQELAVARTHLDTLLLHYTVKHPDVIALRSTIKELEDQINTTTCLRPDGDVVAGGVVVSL